MGGGGKRRFGKGCVIMGSHTHVAKNGKKIIPIVRFRGDGWRVV